MDVRLSMMLPEHKKNRFFTSINSKATRFIEFFKLAVVSLHQIRKIIQSADSKNGVVGFGSNDRIGTHGSWGTSNQLLVEAGIPDSAISKRTGHRSMDSISDY